MTLKEAIVWAEEKGVALGHFNISEIAALRAIVRAAGELKVPVLIGTSEGEAEFVDMDIARAMVSDEVKDTGQAIFLNADHFKKMEKVEEAANAGYDSIIFDGAKLPIEENIQKTKEATDLIKSINPDTLVEGELGYIGESSKLLDGVPEGASINDDALPTPDDAKRFVTETGVDLLAPAVGNLHGMFKNAANPRLNIGLIKEIKDAAGVPLVLHGGSGVSDEDFVSAIQAGMRIVHINTEIRIAWRRGMEKALEDKDQITPYKLLPESEEEIYKVVLKRLKLFSGLL